MKWRENIFPIPPESFIVGSFQQSLSCRKDLPRLIQHVDTVSQFLRINLIFQYSGQIFYGEALQHSCKRSCKSMTTDTDPLKILRERRQEILELAHRRGARNIRVFG